MLQLLVSTDDFVWSIASQGKPRGFRVDLHGSPQCLLGTICHAGNDNAYFKCYVLKSCFKA